MGAHHRLGRRTVPVLRPGPPHARRGHQPHPHALRHGHQGSRAGHGGGGHLRLHPGRRVLRREDRRTGQARRNRPGPVLRRRRPGPHGLHRMWRVHDRLPSRRQEHPGQELPRPRRARRRPHPGPHHRLRPARARRRHLGGHPRTHRRLDQARQTPQHHDRRARGGGRRHLGHPAPAALRQGRGLAAATVGRAGPAHAHQLRVDPRGDGRQVHPGARLLRGRGHHLLLPPRLRHPRRAGPLRQGLQRHRRAADPAHRRQGRRPALAPAAARDPAQPPARGQDVQLPPLEPAHRDRAGHAEPGQLAADLRQALRAVPLRLQQAGPRRTQPDVDPQGQRGHPAPGGQDRRHTRRHGRRHLQHAHDRPLPRRMPHLGLARERRGGPVPPRVELPDHVDRRRLGHLGEPRRQPGADDHRAGRARHVPVAQQGRGGLASGAGRGVPAGRAGVA